jgi:uncharacterized protein with ATP-grasp and redox domains
LKSGLECTPCIIRQTLNTLRVSDCDDKISEKVIREVLKKLKKIDYDRSPAYNSDIAYHTFSDITGIEDPYHDVKIKYNKAAMKLYSKLEKIVRNSADRLYSAAKIAIAGNVIDFGVHLTGRGSLDLEDVIEEIKKIPISHDDFHIFAEDLKNAGNILYIADNAGEIVFDRIFINQIIREGKRVVVSVKSGPIINDATMDDVRQVRLDSLVKIIETGNNCIGVNFKLASEEFLKEFESADIIISKGQGNYESLDEIEGKNIFFLLKAKCEKVARELGVRYLDIVFKRSKYYK